jgi:hypothetical protein
VRQQRQEKRHERKRVPGERAAPSKLQEREDGQAAERRADSLRQRRDPRNGVNGRRLDNEEECREEPVRAAAGQPASQRKQQQRVDRVEHDVRGVKERRRRSEERRRHSEVQVDDRAVEMDGTQDVHEPHRRERQAAHQPLKVVVVEIREQRRTVRHERRDDDDQRAGTLQPIGHLVLTRAF